MMLVASATLLGMVSELRDHLSTGRWLLAAMGAVILACDLWVLFEGLRLLVDAAPEPERSKKATA